MKAEQITAATLSRIGSSDTQLIYGLDKDQWLKSITAGQILKGRVLRVYTDNKYGVDFGGQERIVDSAVPFSKGDMLTGRVVGVNEHTVSMKFVSNALDSSKIDKAVITKSAEYKSPIEIEAERYRVNLNQLQESAIISASNRSANTTVAIRVGLYLAKLGLPITAELVRLLANRVLDKQNSHFTDFDKKVPELTSNIAITETQESNSAQTLENLKNFFIEDFDTNNQNRESTEELDLEAKPTLVLENQLSKGNLDKNQSDLTNRKNLNQLLLRILNVSNGSHAQHRFQTLPLIIDGKLVEFDVAFFDQSARDSTNLVLKSRCLKFALKTEFGFLSLEARVLNDRLNISFSSESDYLVAQLEEYESDLNSNLIDAGWTVDNIKYQKVGGEGTAAYDIVNHVLQQNSLDIAV